MERSSTWIAGADGFKRQWFVVLKNQVDGELVRRVVPTFAGLLRMAEAPSIVAVDIPIGLPEFAMKGGRKCEQEAREKLRPHRASSVFSALGRRVLQENTRVEAHEASRAGGGVGVGAQAWGLAEKLADADAAMTPNAQRFLREVHPEICFWAMNNQVPMLSSKKVLEGIQERQKLLIGAGFPAGFIQPMARDLRVGADDFLDACAALWTAERIVNGCARRMPDSPDLDAKGLDQAIWY